MENKDINIVVDEFGKTHEIKEEMSRGGQGVIHKTGNRNIIIKLQHNQDVDESQKERQRKEFERLQTLPIPANTNITTPISILQDSIGYTMELLNDMIGFEESFRPSGDVTAREFQKNSYLRQLASLGDGDDVVLVDLKKNNVGALAVAFAEYISTGGLTRRMEAHMKVACYLAKLHSVGLVYCDISSQNLFISKSWENTHVWLIDVDNLDFQAKTRKRKVCTPYYAAPEVQEGKGSTFYSDTYALAISTFWSTMGIHPFVDTRAESEAESDCFSCDFIDDQIFSSENIPWIFDEESEGADVCTMMPYHYVYSLGMQSIYKKMFSQTGKDVLYHRPTAIQFAEELAEAWDTLVRCPQCHMEYQYFEVKKEEDTQCCPYCEAKENCVLLHVYPVHFDGERSEKDKRKDKIFVKSFMFDEKIKVPKRLISENLMGDLQDSAFLIVTDEHTCVIEPVVDGAKIKHLENGIPKSLRGKCSVPAVVNQFLLRCEVGDVEKEIKIEVIRNGV